jgi:hypothetical protein
MVDRIGAERSLLHTLQSDPDLRLRIEEHLTRSNSDARLREQDIDAVTADILESYKGKPEERKSLESTLLQGSSTGRAAYVNKVLNNFS